MASKQYEEQLKRLQSEQNKALNETKGQLDHWQTFKADYQALKERLVTLPDQLTHDVMVPFGKMAFMPGQLVHTNEILVLLGENWFTERSAKQAAEIIDRRLLTVDKHIEDLNKQLALLQPRLDFTADLENINKGQDGVVDIREDYDEEKELAWKVEHRKKVQSYKRQLLDYNNREDLANQNLKAKNRAPSKRTDEELWNRLDQLEQLETRRKEMAKIGTSAESKLENQPFPEWETNSQGHTGESYMRSSDGSWVPLTNTSKHSNENALSEGSLSESVSRSSSDNTNQTVHQSSAMKNTVSSEHTTAKTSSGTASTCGSDIGENTGGVHKDDNTATESDSESDILDSDDDDVDTDDGGDGSAESEEEGQGDGPSVGKGTLITFKHTQAQQMSTATQVGDFPQTPGELYTRYYKPKSILKTPVEPGKRKVKKKTAVPKVAFDTASEDETIHTVPVKKSFQNLLPAFSGAVFERPVSKVIGDNSKSVVMATNHNEVTRNPVVERTIGQSKSDREDKTSSKPVSRFKAQRQK